VALLLSFASAHFSRGADCDVTDKEFFQQLKSMNDWPAIYAVFKRNLPACADDGVYAEGYTGAVVGVLARRWSDLAQLQKLVRRDETFRRFVYRHIDATAQTKDLQLVLQNVQTKCSVRFRRLCTDVGARTQRAMDQQRSLSLGR